MRTSALLPFGWHGAWQDRRRAALPGLHPPAIPARNNTHRRAEARGRDRVDAGGGEMGVVEAAGEYAACDSQK